MSPIERWVDTSTREFPIIPAEANTLFDRWIELGRVNFPHLFPEGDYQIRGYFHCHKHPERLGYMYASGEEFPELLRCGDDCQMEFCGYLLAYMEELSVVRGAIPHFRSDEMHIFDVIGEENILKNGRWIWAFKR